MAVLPTKITVELDEGTRKLLEEIRDLLRAEDQSWTTVPHTPCSPPTPYRPYDAYPWYTPVWSSVVIPQDGVYVVTPEGTVYLGTNR